MRPLPRWALPFLILLFVGGMAIRSYRLNAPFSQYFEIDGAIHGCEFRNLHRYGFLATRGWPCELRGWRAPGERLPSHASHWPLSLWLNVLFQKAVGIGASPMPEWSIRALSVFSAALTPVLFFLLVRRWTDDHRAAIAACVSTLLPGAVYFSQSLTFHVSLTFLLVFAAFLCYVRWREAPTPWRFGGMLLAVACACGSIWEGYYLVPTLILFHASSRGARPWRFTFWILAVALVLAAVLLGWSSLLYVPEGGLVQRMLFRTTRHPLGTLLAKAFLRVMVYDTPIAACLGAAWLWRAARRGRGAPISPWMLWILLWFAWGLYDLFLVDFWYYHAYAVYPTFVFMSCASADVGVGFWEAGGRRRRIALLLGMTFLLSCGVSACLIHRHYLRLRPPAVSEALAGSLRKMVQPGEDVFTTLFVEPVFVEFYADAKVIREIRSPRRLEEELRNNSRRRFRWLVLATPAIGESEDEGVLTEDASFRKWLDAHYVRREDPPFLYYDLEHPVNP